MLNIFKDPKKVKLDSVTNEILNLQVTKKELEIEIRNLKNTLDVSQKEHSFLVDSERRKLKAEAEDERSNFQRKERNLIEDNKRLEEKLKSEHETKLSEAIAYAKLDAQQTVAQLKMDYEKKINEIKTTHSAEISELRSSLASKYYEDLHQMMTKFNTEGTVTTQFIQQMALGMMEKDKGSQTTVKVLSSNEH